MHPGHTRSELEEGPSPALLHHCVTHQHHHTPVQDATVVAEATVRAEQGILHAVAPVRAEDSEKLGRVKSHPYLPGQDRSGPWQTSESPAESSTAAGPRLPGFSPFHTPDAPSVGEGRPGASSQDHPGPAPPGPRQGHAMDRHKPALLGPGAQPRSPEASGCGVVMGPQEEPISGTWATQ